MNENRGTYTYQEIRGQTAAWQQAIELVLDLDLPDLANYQQVIFTGCGSTYYLSLAGAALLQQLTGKICRAVPGGDLLLNPESVLVDGATLLVAVSRSGTTTETVKAAERFKKEGKGDVLVVSNFDEALSRTSDRSIAITKGQEISVAQTRSFASMYVGVTALCAKWAGRTDLLQAMRSLPAIGDQLIERYEPLTRELMTNDHFDRIYFLGSGALYGLACEINLKMKEMSLTHSEPFHFSEFRHGPMSMVTETSMVVGFVSQRNQAFETKVLDEMRAKGATIFSQAETNASVIFNSGLPEEIRGVLYLPVGQLLAYYRSLGKRLDPDKPENLTQVVKLDL